MQEVASEKKKSFKTITRGKLQHQKIMRNLDTHTHTHTHTHTQSSRKAVKQEQLTFSQSCFTVTFYALTFARREHTWEMLTHSTKDTDVDIVLNAHAHTHTHTHTHTR